jgi:hypothetical protein
MADANLSRARFLVVSAAGFLAAGLALYYRALTIPFVADDWEFLVLIDTSRSIAVCFDLLVGRFVRPLVMFTYYAGYKLFGLWPLPYHVAAILLHVVNAWLLCLLTIRLDPRHRRWIGVGTGLLFLAFAGHTEAVTWVAGLADPFVAACLFAMLLAEDRALDSARPWPWMLAAGLLMAVAVLGKESALVLPVVAGAYGLARGAPPRRILIYIAVPVALAGAYWIVRTRTYGMPTNAYAGLGGYGGMLFAHARALLIRAFLPPSDRIAQAWLAGRDVVWFLFIAATVAAAIVFRRTNRRALAFSVCALAITLAPAFPLSLSLATSESERMVYVPTAFAALITVFTIDALSTRRALTATLVAALVAGHAVLLQRMHTRWRAAGDVFDGVTRSFVAGVRLHDPGRDGLIFILSMPDNVYGAYVFRRGFYAALHFLAPDLEARAATIVPVESQMLRQPADAAVARRLGPLEFSLDISPDIFLSLEPPVRPFYTFPQWTRTNYVLRFTSAIGKAAVFHVASARAEFLGDVSGPGAPFGAIDIPADDVMCEGQVRFSGWTLDDREVTEVIATRGRIASDAAGDEAMTIGRGTWAYGTRPDVARAYNGFPHTNRAEWNYRLECAALAAAASDTVRIGIRAIDADGHRTDLGVRTVRLRSSGRIAR